MNNIRYDNIPEDLKVLHQWVCWRKHKCKDSKIPVTPGTDSNASVTDPTTWRDYDSALRWYQSRYYDGIGFVFSDNDPYCGIDLDSCRDTETGSINDKALDIIQRLSSYTEISQSGEGIHVIARAKLPAESGNKSGDFEMYDSVRYFCITGDRIDKYPSTIEDRQVQVNQLCNEIFSKPTPTRNQPQPAITITLSDHEIIDRANNAANGDKFMKLMAGDTTGYYHSDGSPDPSQADLALCSILAFWTQNADQIFRIVRNSGLYDDKWDREDYRNRTIKLALDTVKNHYSGNKGWSDMSVGLSEHKVVFHNTDMGNAKRLAYYYSDNIKYCHEMKTWFIWDCKRWVKDDAGDIQNLAKNTVMKIHNETSECIDDKERIELAQHAIRSESYQKIRDMIELAKSESGIPVRPQDMDRDRYLLNCENGMIDLRTGELSVHSREHLISRIIPVIYNPQAECPRWIEFLSQIFNGDSTLMKYVQVIVGYTLTADIREQVFFVLYGTGANGKSTFLDTLLYIMGDYGIQARPETFEDSKKSGSSSSEDIARLWGRRFISSIETRQGCRLAENLIKQMTGDRVMTARYLYRESFQFDQTYKLFIATNYKPMVSGSDDAIWRRVKLIPFEVTIPEDRQDKELYNKLIQESSGILNWALEGCHIWQEHGLYELTSDKVNAATREYRSEMDTIRMFINENCNITEEGRVTAKDIYAAYTNFCKNTGDRYETQKTFGSRLKSLYPELGKINNSAGNIVWTGINLRAE